MTILLSLTLYRDSCEELKIKEESGIVSLSATNHSDWRTPLQKYIQYVTTKRYPLDHLPPPRPTHQRYLDSFLSLRISSTIRQLVLPLLCSTIRIDEIRTDNYTKYINAIEWLGKDKPGPLAQVIVRKSDFNIRTEELEAERNKYRAENKGVEEEEARQDEEIMQARREFDESNYDVDTEMESADSEDEEEEEWSEDKQEREDRKEEEERRKEQEERANQPPTFAHDPEALDIEGEQTYRMASDILDPYSY